MIMFPELTPDMFKDPTFAMDGKIGACFRLLKEFATCPALLYYDSTVCWGCGGRYKENQHFDNCLLSESRRLLGLPMRYVHKEDPEYVPSLGEGYYEEEKARHAI